MFPLQRRRAASVAISAATTTTTASSISGASASVETLFHSPRHQSSFHSRSGSGNGGHRHPSSARRTFGPTSTSESGGSGKNGRTYVAAWTQLSSAWRQHRRDEARSNRTSKNASTGSGSDSRRGGVSPAWVSAGPAIASHHRVGGGGGGGVALLHRLSGGTRGNATGGAASAAADFERRLDGAMEASGRRDERRAGQNTGFSDRRLLFARGRTLGAGRRARRQREYLRLRREGLVVAAAASAANAGGTSASAATVDAAEGRLHPCLYQRPDGRCPAPHACAFVRAPADLCLTQLRFGFCRAHKRGECPWEHRDTMFAPPQRNVTSPTDADIGNSTDDRQPGDVTGSGRSVTSARGSTDSDCSIRSVAGTLLVQSLVEAYAARASFGSAAGAATAKTSTRQLPLPFGRRWLVPLDEIARAVALRQSQHRTKRQQEDRSGHDDAFSIMGPVEPVRGAPTASSFSSSVPPTALLSAEAIEDARAAIIDILQQQQQLQSQGPHKDGDAHFSGGLIGTAIEDFNGQMQVSVPEGILSSLLEPDVLGATSGGPAASGPVVVAPIESTKSTTTAATNRVSAVTAADYLVAAWREAHRALLLSVEQATQSRADATTSPSTTVSDGVAYNAASTMVRVLLAVSPRAAGADAADEGGAVTVDSAEAILLRRLATAIVAPAASRPSPLQLGQVVQAMNILLVQLATVMLIPTPTASKSSPMQRLLRPTAAVDVGRLLAAGAAVTRMFRACHMSRGAVVDLAVAQPRLLPQWQGALCNLLLNVVGLTYDVFWEGAGGRGACLVGPRTQPPVRPSANGTEDTTTGDVVLPAAMAWLQALNAVATEGERGAAASPTRAKGSQRALTELVHRLDALHAARVASRVANAGEEGPLNSVDVEAGAPLTPGEVDAATPSFDSTATSRGRRPHRRHSVSATDLDAAVAAQCVQRLLAACAVLQSQMPHANTTTTDVSSRGDGVEKLAALEAQYAADDANEIDADKRRHFASLRDDRRRAASATALRAELQRVRADAAVEFARFEPELVGGQQQRQHQPTQQPTAWVEVSDSICLSGTATAAAVLVMAAAHRHTDCVRLCRLVLNQDWLVSRVARSKILKGGDAAGEALAGGGEHGTASGPANDVDAAQEPLDPKGLRVLREAASAKPKRADVYLDALRQLRASLSQRRVLFQRTTESLSAIVAALLHIGLAHATRAHARRISLAANGNGSAVAASILSHRGRPSTNTMLKNGRVGGWVGARKTRKDRRRRERAISTKGKNDHSSDAAAAVEEAITAALPLLPPFASRLLHQLLRGHYIEGEWSGGIGSRRHSALVAEANALVAPAAAGLPVGADGVGRSNNLSTVALSLLLRPPAYIDPYFAPVAVPPRSADVHSAKNVYTSTLPAAALIDAQTLRALTDAVLAEAGLPGDTSGAAATAAADAVVQFLYALRQAIEGGDVKRILLPQGRVSVLNSISAIRWALPRAVHSAHGVGGDNISSSGSRAVEVLSPRCVVRVLPNSPGAAAHSDISVVVDNGPLIVSNESPARILAPLLTLAIRPVPNDGIATTSESPALSTTTAGSSSAYLTCVEFPCRVLERVATSVAATLSNTVVTTTSSHHGSRPITGQQRANHGAAGFTYDDDGNLVRTPHPGRELPGGRNVGGGISDPLPATAVLMRSACAEFVAAVEGAAKDAAAAAAGGSAASTEWNLRDPRGARKAAEGAARIAAVIATQLTQHVLSAIVAPAAAEASFSAQLALGRVLNMAGAMDAALARAAGDDAGIIVTSAVISAAIGFAVERLHESSTARDGAKLLDELHKFTTDLGTLLQLPSVGAPPTAAVTAASTTAGSMDDAVRCPVAIAAVIVRHVARLDPAVAAELQAAVGRDPYVRSAWTSLHLLARQYFSP